MEWNDFRGDYYLRNNEKRIIDASLYYFFFNSFVLVNKYRYSVETLDFFAFILIFLSYSSSSYYYYYNILLVFYIYL